MSKRQHTIRQLADNKSHAASLDEKLLILLLALEQAQQQNQPSLRTELRYIFAFWQVVSGAMLAYYDPETTGYRQLGIFALTTTLNLLSQYAWIARRPLESFTYLSHHMNQDYKKIFDGLSSNQAKEKIKLLRASTNQEKYARIMNARVRQDAFLPVFSNVISTICESIANHSGQHWLLLLGKNVAMWAFNYLITSVSLRKLIFIDTDAFRQQKETSDLLRNLLNTIFVDLAINTESGNADEHYLGRENVNYTVNDTGYKDQFDRNTQKNNFTTKYFFTMNFYLITLHFSKQTKIKHHDEIIVDWDYLIVILASYLNQKFSNLILDTSTHTLKIAIFPRKVHPVNSNQLLQELYKLIRLNAKLLTHTHAHCQALTRETQVLNYSPWTYSCKVNNGRIQVTLSYSVSTLSLAEITALVEGLTAEGYHVEQTSKCLLVTFNKAVGSFERLKGRLAELELSKENTDQSFDAKHTQAASSTGSTSLYKTYFPHEEKTCSLTGSFLKLRRELSRYIPNFGLWWNQSSSSPQQISPTIFKFGTLGTCVVNPTLEQKVVPLHAMDKTAIRRLTNHQGIPTNQFIIVTKDAQAQIDSLSPIISKDIWLRVSEAKMVIHHTSSQTSQRSGFTYSTEVLGNKSIYIKLLSDKTTKSLCATKAFWFEQADGQKAIINIIDIFEELHGRTTHGEPPKPQPAPDIYKEVQSMSFI